MTVSDGSDPTGDQRALRDTLRGLLVTELPTAALRAALETDVGYSPQLHTGLAAELGLAGLTIPGEFGGLGLSQAEACVVHTEVGRALYPGPDLAGDLTAGVLAATVPATGDRAIAERWLPQLADGSVTGTIAVADSGGLWSSAPGSVRAHLTPTAGGCTAALGTSWQLTWRASSWCRLWPDRCPRCSWWSRMPPGSGSRPCLAST